MDSKLEIGLINILVVYKDEIPVGRGYMILHYNHWHHPVLSSHDGGDLEEEWYKLVVVDQRLVVWNGTIQ